jgi:tRNA G18 (ribose-2'-O)-methylase SpoU
MMRKLKLSELGRLDVDGFRAAAKVPVVLILDNLRSAHNVGSLFRTSDAFALEGLALCGFTGQPPHREIEKTALGATESVNWAYFSTTTEAITHYKSLGFSIVGIEQTTSSVPMSSFEVDTSLVGYALVLGNEVEGVSDEALELCDQVLELEQFGTKHSLNVAVCGGIFAWYFASSYFTEPSS